MLGRGLYISFHLVPTAYVSHTPCKVTLKLLNRAWDVSTYPQVVDCFMLPAML